MICSVCSERFNFKKIGSLVGWKYNKYVGYESFFYCSKECKERDEKGEREQ